MKNKFLFVLALLILVLAACGKEGMTAGEIADVLPALVEQSAVLNQVYFGEGFLPNGDAGASPMAGYYYADSLQKGFATIEDIRAATEAVFTPEYAALLYGAAFEGVTNGETVIAPRYIEGEMGILQAIGGSVYALPARVYHYDTLAVVKSSGERATVSVETSADGETVTVELIVVRTETEDGYAYRLDSPTY